MLSGFRAFTKSPWFLGLAGLLILAFATWGVGDVFLSRESSVVAKVDGTEISADAYQRSFQTRLRQIAQEENRSLTLAEAREEGLDREVLNTLIDQAAVDSYADELGITISDSALLSIIESIPAFAGPAGFDRTTYRTALASQGMTPATFEGQLRNSLRREQVFLPISSTMIAQPKVLQETLYRYLAEVRNVRFVTLTPDLAGDVNEPTEDELQRYYEANQARFREEETRDVTVLRLRFSDIAQEVSIGEEAIADRYEALKDQYVEPARRTVSLLAFPDRAAAEAAKATLDTGTPFATIAATTAATLTELGSVTRDEIIDQSVAEAVFTLPQVGLTDIVEGDLAFVIAKIDRISPETRRTLDEVREDLRAELVEEETLDRMLLQITEVEDRIAGGEPLEDIGGALDIPVISFSRLPADPSTDSSVPDALVDPNIAATALENEPGFEPFVLEDTENGYYALRVNAVNDPFVPDFAAVRDAVAAAWREEQIANSVAERAADIRTRLQDGQSLDQIAAGSPSLVALSATIDRRGSPSAITGEVRERALAAPLDGVVTGRLGNGQDMAVVQVQSIRIEALPQQTQILASLEQQLASSYANEAAELFVKAIRAETEVEINEEAVATALTRG